MFKKGKKLSPKTITHKFTGKEDDNKILIEGSYDVNVWYSYDNDTKTAVLTKTIYYTEEENVNQKHKSDSQKDVIIRSLKQPSCINAKENGNSITLEIEKELGIELIGDTKVKVAIEEDEEPWDILGDNNLEEDVEKEIDNIDENFINEKNTI